MIKKHCVLAGVIKLLPVALIAFGLESAFSIWEPRIPTFPTGANERIANVGIGADNLSRFFATSSGSGGKSGWPVSRGDIVLWPSYFCFVVASVSVVFGAIVVTAYYWGTDAANKWDDRHGTFTKVAFLVKLALLAAVAGSMYSTHSATTLSIWGISCNAEPQTVSQKIINYGQLCTMQKLMFSLSVISAFAEVLTGVTYVLGFLSTRQKKKMEKHNSMMTLPSPTVEGKAVDVKTEYVDE